MTPRRSPVRRLPPLALLALLTCGGALGACNQIFGIQGGSPGTGGQGGAGPTSSALTSTSASTTGASTTGASTTGTSTTSASSSATSTSATSTSATSGSTTGTGGSTTSTSATSGSSGGAPDGGVLEGCVLLLHMDEPSWSGAGAVVDASGHGNDGTALGTATPTASGKFGGAALFDGSNGGYIDVPDSVSLDPTAAITYAAWVYPTGLTDGSASPGILSKRVGFQDDVSYTLFLWTGNTVFADLQGPTTAARWNSTAVVTNDQWYHLAVVYDGSLADPTQRARLYVNGAPSGNATAADPMLMVNNADLQIGNLPGGGNAFTGRIDEVAIWSRALSAGEIAGLYAATGPL